VGWRSLRKITTVKIMYSAANEQNLAVRGVPDSAGWVACLRALQTRRPDTLFRDPYAEGLVAHRGSPLFQAVRRGAGACAGDVEDRGSLEARVSRIPFLAARAGRKSGELSVDWRRPAQRR
jgi:O-methyltransferase involved in polyketide biosynthesis